MNQGGSGSPTGILVIDKPGGLTSHQVVSRVRRAFGTRKVGHAGTLDPMATGVLIVGIGRATRLLGHLALHDKAYSATIRLGAATTTDDAEGDVVSAVDASGLDLAAIEQAMSPLRGEILQRPSSVSAIKINGKRAHAMVRAGEQVEIPARPVTVSRFEVAAHRVVGDFLDLDVEVECSSGTYVRALARDLGEALGVGGHLTRLRRTRIGHYLLDHAVELESLSETTPLMPMAKAAELSFPVLVADEIDEENVRHGRRITAAVTQNPTGIISREGELLGLYQPATEGAKAVTVFVGS